MNAVSSLQKITLAIATALVLSLGFLSVETVQAQETCPDGFQLKEGKCINEAQKRQKAYELIGKRFNDTDQKKAFEDYKKQCTGPQCSEETLDKFKTGAFASSIIECTEKAAQNGKKKDFFSCLKGKYPSLNSDDIARLMLPIDINKAAADIAQAGTQDPVREENDEESEKTCATELSGIGWIVCAIISSAANFADGIWSLFEWLLLVNPLSSDPSNAYYKTWETMRNIANALMFVVFLLIIFSQISNFGISNYGIKRMLPRFIIVAIAINISYFLMQIAVDVANILGSTIDDLLTSSVESLDTSKVGWEQLVIDLAASGLTFGVPAIAGVAVAAVAVSVVGAPVALMFAFLLIVPGIIGMAAGIMALFFRHAVIPILAIIAPIALVAWVLPNTQKLFDKWRSTFTSLLFLYPLAALYYGALKFLALNILNGDPETTGTFYRLMALSLLFIGSFVVIIIAIKSNSIVGGVMKGISGAFNKVVTPIRNAGMGAVGGAAALKRQQLLGKEIGPSKGIGRFNPIKFGQRRIQAFDRNKWAREQGMAVAKGDREQAYQAWAQGQGGKSKFENISGITDQSATGKAYMNQLTEAAVKNQEAKLSSASIRELGDELRRAISSGDSIGAMAAQNRLLTSGPPGLKEFNKQLAATDGGGAMYGDLSANFRASHAALMSQDNVTQAWATADLNKRDAAGNLTYEETSSWSNAEDRAMDRIIKQGITAEKFAGLSDEAQSRIFNNAIGPATKQASEAQSNMSTETLTVLADASTNQGSKISDNVREGIISELSRRNKTSDEQKVNPQIIIPTAEQTRAATKDFHNQNELHIRRGPQ